MERLVYTSESLSIVLRSFEAQFGMSSHEFYSRHRAEDDSLSIPRFERHVWASMYEDVLRMTRG